VRLRLAPLLALPPTVRERAESTLRAWCGTHGDVTAAATLLGVHPQTVRYRLASLRDAFGDALDDPRSRLEIELALQVLDVPTP
jgi:DNA-binding PucR family transcriptional regulator